MKYRFDFMEILGYLQLNCPWHKSELHGLSHWRRVERNGVFLAEHNSVDVDLVRLFALFHDCQRLNDDSDLQHGPRAAAFIRKINSDLLGLSVKELEALTTACYYHTNSLKTDNPYYACCWDADRLDIGRAGIDPQPKFFSTKIARKIVNRDQWDKLTEFEYISVFDLRLGEI